jgi:hypothetical protein
MGRASTVDLLVQLVVAGGELKGGLQRHWTRYFRRGLASNHSSLVATPGPCQSPPPKYSREPNPWSQACCHHSTADCSLGHTAYPARERTSNLLAILPSSPLLLCRFRRAAEERRLVRHSVSRACQRVINRRTDDLIHAAHLIRSLACLSFAMRPATSYRRIYQGLSMDVCCMYGCTTIMYHVSCIMDYEKP